MKKIISACLFAIFMLFVSMTTVLAANEPYGFTFSDAVNGRTIYRFYSYNEMSNRYVTAREFYSSGMRVFNTSNAFISDTYGSDGQYNGFDANGNFYIITPTQKLVKVDTNGIKSTVIEAGCISLNYTVDTLADSVQTASGKVSLATLEALPEDPETETETPSAPKSPTRVDMYINSLDEIVYEAFNNGNLTLKLVVSTDGQRVLNETVHVRLTDSLVGAKFVGIDSSYNIYLYEADTLYRFKYGSWYSAEKVTLNGTYKGFKNDNRGFISEIITTKSTYSMRALSSPNKWKAKKTYAVTKPGYTTLYVKGTSNSYTLTITGKNLYLNGKFVMSGVKKYGFTSKKIVYIKGSKAYTASLKKPSTGKLLCKKAKSLYVNKTGLVTKVTLKTGKSVKVK